MRLVGLGALALIGGGGLTVIINAGLTPALAVEASSSATAASAIFLVRQSLSAVAAALLLLGSVGLYIRHEPRLRLGGSIAFGLASLGSALLLAHEWSQVFVLRAVAVSAPGILEQMEAVSGPALYELGAMIAVIIFTLGWIFAAVVAARAGVLARRGPLLIMAGLFLVPGLSAALPHPWGAVLGNAVLGSGWALLGLDLRASGRAAADRPFSSGTTGAPSPPPRSAPPA